MYTKATISNRYVEVTHLSRLPSGSNTYCGGRKTYMNQNVERYEKNIKVSINRARKQIRRLLECNFTDQYSFMTLTFSSSNGIDITDIDNCNDMFRKFKKRLDYHLEKLVLSKFKYLGVIEFQDESREGAVHYHIICNLTEVSTETLGELWSYGWVHKANIKSDVTENSKIADYLKKGITDHRLNGRKRYLSSQGLRKPIVLEIENTEEFYNNLYECGLTLLDSNIFNSPFSGELKYENYYIQNAKELMDYVQEF